MPMRVIGGIAKGRVLKVVPGDTTRPIMDRVKESLFNIIGRDIYDAVFLDMFAGTGSVGIEALSRGAAHATFWDLERAAIKTIHDNLAVTRLAERAKVRQGDAFAFLAAAPDRGYTLIYIAPPQYSSLWSRALQAIDSAPGWLAEDGAVIVQIDPLERETPTLRHLTPVDERRYGNTLLWFFERLPTDEPPSREIPTA